MVLPKPAISKPPFSTKPAATQGAATPKKLKAEQDKRIEEYNKQQEENNKNLETESGDETVNNPEVEGDGFSEKEYHKLVEKYKNIILDEINLDEFEKLSEADKTAVRQAVFDEILEYYYSMTPEEAKEAYKKDDVIKQFLGNQAVILERYLNSYN